MNKKVLSSVILGILIFPLAGSAQLEQYGTGAPPISDWHNIVTGIEEATGLIFGAIAVICFVIAGVLFLTAQGAPEKLKEAKSAVIWGVVGVIVGIVAFSIIAIVGNLITK
jgi:hypothetical protein